MKREQVVAVLRLPKTYAVIIVLFAVLMFASGVRSTSAATPDSATTAPSSAPVLEPYPDSYDGLASYLGDHLSGAERANFDVRVAEHRADVKAFAQTAAGRRLAKIQLEQLAALRAGDMDRWKALSREAQPLGNERYERWEATGQRVNDALSEANKERDAAWSLANSAVDCLRYRTPLSDAQVRHVQQIAEEEMKPIIAARAERGADYNWSSDVLKLFQPVWRRVEAEVLTDAQRDARRSTSSPAR